MATQVLLLLFMVVVFFGVGSGARGVEIDGVNYGVFYTSTYPTTSDGAIFMDSDNRIVLLNGQDSQTPTPNSWALFNLLGKTITFDVQLASAGCGCNLALYLVSMNGKSDYCDASGVHGMIFPLFHFFFFLFSLFTFFIVINSQIFSLLS